MANNNSPAPVPVPTDPDTAALLIVGELVETVTVCFTDYAKCHDHEITERQRISACLTAATKQIEAKKAISMEIINRSFNERKDLYDRAQKTMDLALERGDIEMLKAAQNFILQVYQGSPDAGRLIGDMLSSLPSI